MRVLRVPLLRFWNERDKCVCPICEYLKHEKENAMYFDNVANHTIVIDMKHGLGRVSNIQKIGRASSIEKTITHTTAITVTFGRPGGATFNRMFTKDGIEIIDGVVIDNMSGSVQKQTLFYADDPERIAVSATVLPAPARHTMYDDLCLNSRVFDIIFGWGSVKQMTDKLRLINVLFPHGIVTYNDEGMPLDKERYGVTLFQTKDIKGGALTSQLNTRLKTGLVAPAEIRYDRHSLRYIDESAKDVSDTKTWIFFYKPQKARGYLKNIMIGTGGGKTVLEALENVYREEYNADHSRGNAFDEMVRAGEFGQLFAYEACHVPPQEKEKLDCVTHAVKDLNTRNVNGPLLKKAISTVKI